MKIDERAIYGAQNNADLYEAVFDAHGLRHDKLPYAFVGQDCPPPYYSNLTILAPNQTKAVVSELSKLAVRFNGTIGLKDSFCELQLEQNGFEKLFDASWIWLEPKLQEMPDGWKILSDHNELAAWEACWKRNGSPTERRMFPEAILERQDVFFLGKKQGAGFVMGCIANVSNNCVGLSNVFAERPSAHAFSQATDAVGAFGNKRPIVGYESGAELDFAIQKGFTIVGDLRILKAKNARF
ncbi:MAG: hypothetical protein AAFQ64_16520 [Pseudomonadota bacterium]